MAGWHAERLPRLPQEGPLLVTPNRACEVLSPGTERNDRLRKGTP